MQSTYALTAMTCDHCAAAVSGELVKLPGVREVRVDLPSGTVTGYELAGA